MADLDEEVTRLAYTQPGDTDLTEETQDFRFLTQLSLYVLRLRIMHLSDV